MNIVPYSSEPYYQPGRASELVSEVLPAARARDPQRDERGQTSAATEQTQRLYRQAAVVSPLQREALIQQHQASQARAGQPGYSSALGERALHAYNGVQQAQKRDLLDELLGVNEYA